MNTDTTPKLPVLLGLAELAELFPVAKMSVYRWRTQPSFPEPLLTVSRTPMWTVPVIEEFAKQRGLKIDRAALRRIAKAQGH